MMISKEIDPKRKGISKSLITSAALCNRKGYFSERVRLPDGTRIPWRVPEKVAFGAALDEAILHIAIRIREGQEWTQDDAVASGYDYALKKDSQDGIDWGLFRAQLDNAISLFRVDVLREGTEEAPILDFRHCYLQGMDGESLRVGELIGTPDFIFPGEHRENGRTLIVDLKAAARAKSEKDLRSAELSYYAYLWTLHSGGELPEVGYLTYARTAKPKYQLITGPSSGDALLLAEEYVKTTKAILTRSTQEEVGFSTSFCTSCEWRKPIPEASFGGCSVGLLVAADEKEED